MDGSAGSLVDDTGLDKEAREQLLMRNMAGRMDSDPSTPEQRAASTKVLTEWVTDTDFTLTPDPEEIKQQPHIRLFASFLESLRGS